MLMSRHGIPHPADIAGFIAGAITAFGALAVLERDEEAEALAAEAKRISRSSSGVSVRRTIDLEDAGDRAVVRDTATATFEGEGVPLDRMAEIVEALDAARPAIRPRRAAKVGRNAPCPCGSGRKYKKCCGSGSDWRTLASQVKAETRFQVRSVSESKAGSTSSRARGRWARRYAASLRSSSRSVRTAE
jgi:hypothetical protein